MSQGVKKNKKTILNIQVTKADIKAGKPNCVTKCPIALAIIRALNRKNLIPTNYGLKKKAIVCVGIEDTKILNKKYLLPETAITFIEYFDSCGPSDKYPLVKFSIELR